jgi:hypothetical protein
MTDLWEIESSGDGGDAPPAGSDSRWEGDA